MKLALIAAISFALAAPLAATAGDYNSAGNWSIAAGVSRLDPHTPGGVTSSSTNRLSAAGEVFVVDNLGIELYVAAPFRTDFGSTVGGGRWASSKSTTPVLSAKYHFNSNGKFSPFVGVGVGYADYHDTVVDPAGPIAGNVLHLNDTWGAAATVGLDFKIGDTSAIRADVRWMDSNPRVSVNGFDAGRQRMDPTTYSISYVYQF